MNYVIWDIETDSAHPDWATMIEIGAILLDENLMFEEYIETVNIGELNRDHLLEIGKKICLERGETELL